VIVAHSYPPCGRRYSDSTKQHRVNLLVILYFISFYTVSGLVSCCCNLLLLLLSLSYSSSSSLLCVSRIIDDVMFSYNGADGPEKHDVMFRRVRQVAAPVGRQTITVFGQSAAPGAKSALCCTDIVLCIVLYDCRITMKQMLRQRRDGQLELPITIESCMKQFHFNTVLVHCVPHEGRHPYSLTSGVTNQPGVTGPLWGPSTLSTPSKSCDASDN